MKPAIMRIKNTTKQTWVFPRSDVGLPDLVLEPGKEADTPFCSEIERWLKDKGAPIEKVTQRLIPADELDIDASDDDDIDDEESTEDEQDGDTDDVGESPGDDDEEANLEEEAEPEPEAEVPQETEAAKPKKGKKKKRK